MTLIISCYNCNERRFEVASILLFNFMLGTFNDYVDKKRCSNKCLFLSTFRVKIVHVEVGGGQKRAKLCPRSHRMSP